MNDSIMFIVELVIIMVASLFVIKLLFKYWPKTGKMGINLEEVSCCNCKEIQPKARKPSNLRQALWGGWTCDKCGTEMNKYGVKIDP